MSTQKDSLVDQILTQVDLVELISEVTPLQKKGKNYMGLCPFHHEKTPSFSVSEDKNLYHCFSCKASGNAITFVKETKQMTSQEAVHYLADRANITLDTPIKEDPHTHYYKINDLTLDFYSDVLHHTKEGQEALNYLHHRGFTKETLVTFQVGLAPKKRDALYQTLKAQEILYTDMTDLGLVYEKEGYFDAFYQRIMFPIHDDKNHTVGFSGRIYERSQKSAPKYINSPKTPVFDKGAILYNLHRAKADIKKRNRVVLFEGYFDVMKAYQAGIKEAVAVMGTSLSEKHRQLLKKYTSNVILCFDGDEAGLEATDKFIEDLKQSQFDITVAELEAGLDPDDFISQYGENAFNDVIDHAKDVVIYQYHRWFKKVNLERMTEVEKFKNKVFQLISDLSSYQQETVLNKLSQDLKTRYDILVQDFKTIRKKALPSFKKVPKIAITNKFIKTERGFIRYFMREESYVRRFRYHFKDTIFNDRHARDIELEIFQYYDFHKQTCIVPSLFKDSLTDTQKAYFEQYIEALNYPYDDQEFEDYLQVMHDQMRLKKVEALKKKIEETENRQEKIKLKKEIDEINKEANNGKRKNHSRTARY